MDKRYFIKLLQKYQLGDITAEEARLIEAYYNLFKDEPDVLMLLGADEREKLGKEILNNIWREVSNKEHLEVAVWFRRKWILRTAIAAVVLTGLLGSIILFYHFSLKKNNKVIATTFTPFHQKSATEIATVLSGHQKENRVIFLPDGSKVILSPGSKLNYPSSFDGMNKRVVFLDGQAFFDIKHNVSRPFIVHTGNLETVVLGTAFNIKAIPGEKDITVTVKRGKVRVSNNNKVLGIINPNQQITYDKQHIIAAVTTVSNESYLTWQDKDLFIDNLTISEAARLMEERYKVKIIINDPEVESLRFTTTFPKKERFEQTLNSICLFNNLSYHYNKEKAIVTIIRK